MLSTLDHFPKHIDDIVEELSRVFIGVDRDTLKEDTIEFLQYLVDEGYLSFGETLERCLDIEIQSNETSTRNSTSVPVNSDECVKNLFKTNEFLRSIHIEIANACNERCVHCYIPHEHKNKVMNSSLFYNILEDGRKMNIIHVTLSGGEPLLHKDIIGFLDMCRKQDLSVNILSNLTVLTEEIVSEMVKNPLLSVQTSLYSMDARVHDSITNLPGSLEKTIRGLERLQAAGIPLQISCPVMKQNKDCFVDVIRWGKDHNIAVAVEPVIFASYDHTCSNLLNRLTLEEISKAIDLELGEGYAEPLLSTAKEKEALIGEDPICSICRYSFCVSVTGDVYPCVGWQTNVLGNLATQTLEEIWNNSEQIKCLRQVKRKDFPKCVNCEDRGYCTICMMSNSNENPDGDAFKINEFHCHVAAITHKKVGAYDKTRQN